MTELRVEAIRIMQGGNVQLNVYVPRNLHLALKQRAEEEDRAMSRVVRKALVQYLLAPPK